ncbi:speckle-type POZ protein-like [Nasonia vitripennis]|uniref:MATH domain-containing protein n=1 Tax=Nasonia vitripennis TaxID=7425 RepID=A0A7M7LUG0_NASVI|nr:speckle-type POZ protein-like [Nasonia vitripennis]
MRLIRGTVHHVLPYNYYEWTIENFTSQVEKYEIQSPSFLTRFPLVRVWWMCLNPRGDSEENTNYLSLFLYCRCSTLMGIPVSARFSTLSNENEETRNSVIVVREPSYNQKFGISRFSETSRIMDEVLANNDKLVIICDILYVNKWGRSTGMHDDFVESESDTDLESDFETWSWTEEYSPSALW